MNKFVSIVSDWRDRPSLDFLGDEIHHLWYRTTMGRVDRRELMRRVANELLWHLGDDRKIDEDVATVDQRLLDDAQFLTANPENAERKLLADALVAALRLIGHKDDLATCHSIGGRVYGPLMKLAGLRMAPVANPSKPRKLTIPLWQLVEHRRKFMADHAGSAHGWVKAAAAEFEVNRDTIYRHMKEVRVRK